MGFFEEDIFDLFYNVKEIEFDFNATGAAQLALFEAISVMTIGQVQGFDVAGLIIGNALASRVGVSGKTTRVVDPEKCNGVLHRFNEDLCQVFIDLSDVVKNRQGLYYPRAFILFYADGDVFTSCVQGSGGQSIGGIDFPLATNVVEMFPATASALDPIVFGSMNVTERYDEIEAARVGDVIELTGVNFADTSEVSFGDVPSTFSLSADKMKLTADIPDRSPYEPIAVTVRRTQGNHVYQDHFFTRQPFKP